MNQTNLSKILNYENEIFNKFIEKRTNLIKSLNNFNFNLKNFRNIVNCLKCANEYIDNFNDQYTDPETEFIQFYFLCKDVFFTTGSSELSESSESSDSSDDSDDSDSSPDSSPDSSSESSESSDSSESSE